MINKDVRDARQDQEQLEALHRLDEECVHLQRAGNYLQAFDNMERALVLRRHFFGADSPEVVHACRALAEMCNLLSMSFLQQDNFAVTLELLKKAEILSHHHPKEKATTLNNLACYYRRLGKLHTAMTCLKKALTIEKKALKDARNAADTHLNICAVLSQLGKHQQALEHAQAALITLQEEFFNKPKATGTGGNGADSQTNTHQLERVSVMCIAYHNMGVEQEFLHDYEGCVLSYKKGVGLAEQYLGVDHAIATTIRNSYLAAKRTISTKASSARRGTTGLSAVSNKNPRLSTPPSSLRLPSPVTRDKQQRQELPSPRSIVADALARGNTLPPLEPIQKKTASLLTPEDPFFSPRFRFDGCEDDNKPKLQTKPQMESPRALKDQPETIVKEEQTTQVLETETTAAEVVAETETTLAAMVDDQTEPLERPMSLDAATSATDDEPNRQSQAATFTAAVEDAQAVGAPIDEPVASADEPVLESEIDVDEFNRVEADESVLVDHQKPEEDNATPDETQTVTGTREENSMFVSSEKIDSLVHEMVTEPIDEELQSQVSATETSAAIDVSDPEMSFETSDHVTEPVDATNAMAHDEQELGGQTVPDEEPPNESSTPDHAVETKSDVFTHESAIDGAQDRESTYVEVEPATEFIPETPTAHQESTQLETEPAPEETHELLTNDQENTQWENHQALLDEAPIPADSTSADDFREQIEEHAGVAAPDTPWYEKIAETNSYDHGETQEAEQPAVDEAGGQWDPQTDESVESAAWSDHHSVAEHTQDDHVELHAHDESLVSSGEEVVQDDLKPADAGWETTHHTAEAEYEHPIQVTEGAEDVYTTDTMHGEHENHAAEWSSHEPVVGEQHEPASEGHGIHYGSYDTNAAEYTHHNSDEFAVAHEAVLVGAVANAQEDESVGAHASTHDVVKL